MSAQSPDALRLDERLQKSISLRLKNASLVDFATSIQGQLSVPMDVAPNIRDRKVTAIFKNRPASEVMKKVEDLFFMSWKPSGKGYILTLPHDVQNQEDTLLRAEDEAAKKAISQAIRDFASIYDMSPDDLRSKGRDAALKEMALERDNTAEGQAQLPKAKNRLFPFQYPQGAPLGKAFGEDADASAEQLLQGQTLFAGSSQNEPGPHLPPKYADYLTIAGDPVSIVALLRFDPSRRALQAMAATTAANNTTGLSFIFNYEPNLEADQTIKGSKLLASLATWSSDRDPGVLSREISSTRQTAHDSGYFNRSLTLADQLEYVSDQSGVPILADGFRLSCSDTNYASDRTVGACLEDLETTAPRSRFRSQLGYYRTDGDWVLARHRKFWQKLANEIPERTLLPLEQATVKNGAPTLSQFAGLLPDLTVRQRIFFSGDCPDLAVRFDHEPYNSAFQSLELWSKLTTEQRTEAASQSVPIGQMSKDLQRDALEVFVDTLWKGRLPREFWKDLFQGQLGRDGAAFRCIVRGDTADQSVDFHYLLPNRSEVAQGFSLTPPKAGEQVKTPSRRSCRRLSSASPGLWPDGRGLRCTRGGARLSLP